MRDKVKITFENKSIPIIQKRIETFVIPVKM